MSFSSVHGAPSHRPPPSQPRTDFGPPPPGYVPGVGRGAVGFTTRSDIGPARPMEEDKVEKRSRILPFPKLPSLSRNAEEERQRQAEAKETALYSESNFDPFSGYGERLFANDNEEYSAEDREADAIYSAIDRKVASKKRKTVAEKEEKEKEEDKEEISLAARQFVDLKRDLANVTESQWESLSEPLDYSRHNSVKKAQQNKYERFSAVPDSVLASASSTIQSSNGDKVHFSSSISSTSLSANAVTTPSSSLSKAVIGDLTSVGRARDAILGMRLDRVADSVSGQTNVDPQGYMTELSTVKINSAAEISDIKKARHLMQSIIETNPRLPSGYVGLARLEKDTGNLATARAVLLKSCTMCPTSEDVWLETASMHTGKAARAVLAKAVTHLPQSIPLWLLATQLEENDSERKRVLRQALELIPNSVHLWKAAIELEEEHDARVLLLRAVELVPDSLEMWLALARLSSYDEARAVLNKARKALPRESSIWLAAAKLEEKQGHVANVRTVIDKALRTLSNLDVRFDRDHWLNEAEQAELAGAPFTCEAVIQATLALGVDPLDQQNTFQAYAKAIEAKGAIVTARAVYTQLLEMFPKKIENWIAAAQFERRRGDREHLIHVLQKGVERCSDIDILWLMWAKEVWQNGQVDEARSILEQAHRANPESEEIWLAAMKIEFEQREFVRARQLLELARRSASSARVYVKSAKLERILGETAKELALLEEGVKKFPNAWKLFLMLAQFYVRKNHINEARDIYKQAVRACPLRVEVWSEFAWFEIMHSHQIDSSVQNAHLSSAVINSPSAASGRARALLETARTRLPQNETLWLTAVRIEQRINTSLIALATPHQSPAAQTLTKALKECPRSGLLWAHAILSDTRTSRRQRALDAIRNCPESVHVHLAVARLFWLEGKHKKAREWFERAVAADKDWGDVWSYYLRFERESAAQGDKQNNESSIISRCTEADPVHGDLWTSVSKDDRYANSKSSEIVVECANRLQEIVPGEPIVTPTASTAANAI